MTTNTAPFSNSALTRISQGNAPIAVISAGIMLTVLTSCSAALIGETTEESSPAIAGSSSSPSTESPTPSPEPIGARDLDFGNMTWNVEFAQLSSGDPTVDLINGEASLSETTQTYSMGDPIFGDVNGDGIEDAVISLATWSGGVSGGASGYWAWIMDEQGAASQIPYPIAYSVSCGDSVNSVEITADGVVINEHLRTLNDVNLACAMSGTTERTRTVVIEDIGPEGEPWPVQTAPMRGFGGVCPGAVGYDAYPLPSDAYASPNLEGPSIEGELFEFAIEEVRSVAVPEGWLLWGVKGSTPDLSCAWIPQ